MTDGMRPGARVAAIFLTLVACAMWPAPAFADMISVPRPRELLTDPGTVGLITISAGVVVAVAVGSLIGLRRLSRWAPPDDGAAGDSSQPIDAPRTPRPPDEDA